MRIKYDFFNFDKALNDCCQDRCPSPQCESLNNFVDSRSIPILIPYSHSDPNVFPDDLETLTPV